ncbi:TonB-dependent receptor [Acidobacterium sp. S8]|uniref:TonB-dependent receptor n=1 Tax=Acidobacterium sp. S8 TaxID=1641854 RepID=UPI00131CFAD1|nr:TonB-dependent receptor [Acidobacterium sp. S8]
MMQRFWRRLTLVLCLAFAATIAVSAQSTTEGAIAGTVLDANSSVVSNAAVKIHNDGTNAEFDVTADESGYFKAPLLPPGTYTVSVSASGFNDLRLTSVVVGVGQLTTLQPHLTVGAVSSTVTVSGAAPIINTESPDFSSNLSLTTINNLPINGRRWSDLTLLTPGVVADSNGFGLLSIRGISPLLNNVQIDGADDNQAYFSEERGRTREGYSTPQVAVQEFQVNTGVYSAEYGRALGGVINSVTKSGTNQIHGQLYFYDRDNDWGAKNPFTKLTTFDAASGTTNTIQYKPKDWRKQWGLGVGGPLIKDKLFWFYAYDGYRRNFPGTAVASNPGAFFQAPDPNIPGGYDCATIISSQGKTAPSNPVDAQACVLQARLGLSSYSAAVSLYNTDLAAVATNLGPVHRTGDQTINMPKIDWQINGKNHASFIYNRLRWDSPGGVQTQATNTYGIDGFGNDFVKLDYGLAKLDSVLTPTIANELRYQYGRELNDENSQPVSAYDAQFVNSTSFQGLPPTISLQSSNGFSSGVQYYAFRPAYPDERKWQIADTVSWIRNQHSLKFGVDVVHNFDLINSLGLAASSPNGDFTYTYLGNFFADQAKPSGTCGSSANEYNVGTLPCYSSFSQNFGQSTFNLSTVDYGFFGQDDWKILPNLTLNLGLRYDFQSIPGPYKNLQQPVGSYTSIPEMLQHPDDKNNFGPRAGFAWNVYGKGTTVLRGGFGMYYGRIPNAILLTAYSQTGSPNAQFSSSFRNYQAGPQFPSILPSNYSPTALAAASVQYLDKHLQNPQAMEYDLTLQQQFGPQTVFSLSYLGTQSRELTNFVNTNLVNTAAPDNNTNNGDGYTTVNYTIQAASNGSCGPLACGSTYAAKVYNGYANPNFAAITDVVSNINASYNALVAEINNQTSRYVTFDASYTWSHSLDFNQNQSTQASANQPLDPNSSEASQYGNSNFNVPNRFVAYAVVKYPNQFQGWESYLLDGWRLNPLVQLQNGLPYSLTTSSYPNGTSPSTGWNGAGGSPAYIPVLGRNTFNYRRAEVFDLRGQKDIQFHEKYTLQLIAECFNVFNHENTTSVNTLGYTFGSSTPAVSAKGYTGPQTYTTPLTYNPSFASVTNVNSNYAYSPRQVQVAVRFEF